MELDRRSAPPVGGGVGLLLEPVYRWFMARRNRGFDAAALSGSPLVKRFPVPVISVGNLSVGGTGKTPMVALLARGLGKRGRRPAVFMRGYKAARGRQGDEQRELAEALGRGVPVIANPNRCAAISAALAEDACDVALLDDGFQHRKVARDVDIVLLDATRDPVNDRCLPAGWLREPLASLARASVIVLTHSDLAGGSVCDDIERACGRLASGIPICRGAHTWRSIRVYAEGHETPREEPVEWLRRRRVFVACGIGNPAALEAAAVSAGAEVVGRWFAPDHHDWSDADGAALGASMRTLGAETILTTAKDWVKLAAFARGTCGVPRLEIELVSGAEAFWKIVEGALR